MREKRVFESLFSSIGFKGHSITIIVIDIGSVVCDSVKNRPLKSLSYVIRMINKYKKKCSQTTLLFVFYCM